MTEEIKKRIEAFQRGEVPEGYKCENGYVIPNEWDTTNFKRVFSRSTKKNRVGCDNVLTISAQMGLISQRDFYEKDIASDDKSEYYLMKKGDFAYNKSYSAGYDYGAIKRLDKYTEGIVSPLYICMTPQSETNSDFYVQYFEAGRYNREIYRFAQEGARNHGLLNIAVEDFFNGVVAVPSETEQQKIAEILSTCDKVIELKQKLIEEKRRQKKWLMQKLLNPDSGVRLPGLEGSKWNTVKLKDSCTMFSGGTPKAGEDTYYDDGVIPFIRSAEIGQSQTELFLTEEGLKNSSAKMVEEGDLLYALYGANSGDCAIARIAGAINQAILCIRPQNIDRDFLYQLLCAKKDFIISTYLQGGQGNLSADILKKICVQIPAEKEEQIAISAILKSADTVIDIYEQELAEWQQKKKALMQLLLTGLVRVKT